MKICPRCQRTYADDNLSFCIEDGTVLQIASEAAPTVQMNTAPTAVMPPQAPPRTAAPGIAPQQQWDPGGPAAAGAPGKKGSKTWIWVLAILAVVLVLCGGGILGLIYFVGSQASRTMDEIAANINAQANRSTTRTTTNTSTTAADPAAASDGDGEVRDNVQSVDLSDWAESNSNPDQVATEYTGGEFMMNVLSNDHYYVLIAKEGYTTADSNTRVTLRNVDAGSSQMGYGLVFHSLSFPLIQDYAFLIDTMKQRYRVVRHYPGMEKVVVPWTNSTAIKKGSEPNTIEVRDRPDGAELYINNVLVKKFDDSDGAENGVPGLYSGGNVKIAFKDLEISR
ncbi:MAG: hypothetical protein ACK4S4_06325 [Pyrinomonadaceae bacterium]